VGNERISMGREQLEGLKFQLSCRAAALAKEVSVSAFQHFKQVLAPIS